MDIALTILGVLAAVLVVTAVADRFDFSAPLLLIVVGIGASFIPGLTPPELTPGLVLLGLLPPLLYATAIRTSLIDFRANRRAIISLSVVLVVVTALGVGLITWWLLPVDFAVAFALGAVVAPPDAVAATSIARRVGLPRQLVTILEGESLVNDATAITCLRVAIVAIGGAVSAGEVAGGFLIAVSGGVVGLLVALAVIPIRRRITQPVFDTAISILVPFAAYVPAELIEVGEFHGSGIIAVVTAGLILGHKSPVIQSGQSRLSERVNWTTIQFLLENTVFLLIGLQAQRILTEVQNSELTGIRITVFVLAVLVGVIVIRLAWVSLARIFLFKRKWEQEDTLPPWSHTLVLGWAGLRGVVTLAAAFLIPADVPEREVLILAAMVVTAGTLLFQGLTLPGLVRVLKIRGPDARSDALQAATVMTTAANAGLVALDNLVRPADAPETVELLRTRISARPEAMWEMLGRSNGGETPSELYRRLRLQTLQAERDEVLKIRSSGTIDHDVLEQVLAALDIEESTLMLASRRADQLTEDDDVATPEAAAGSCIHLDQAPAEIAPLRSVICEDCVREGTRTVHLRICLLCGQVGCCDSSPGRHAERHAHRADHAVMRSFEPGESWRWCYVDERIG